MRQDIPMSMRRKRSVILPLYVKVRHWHIPQQHKNENDCQNNNRGGSEHRRLERYNTRNQPEQNAENEQDDEQGYEIHTCLYLIFCSMSIPAVIPTAAAPITQGTSISVSITVFVTVSVWTKTGTGPGLNDMLKKFSGGKK